MVDMTASKKIGTMKWFNNSGGMDLVSPRTVRAYISAVQKAGYTDFVEGAKVSYEEIANRANGPRRRQNT
jgi:cold shock CspA family protein